MRFTVFLIRDGFGIRCPPMFASEKMKLNKRQLWWQLPVAFLTVYLTAAAVVFDFTSPACPPDEEYCGRRPVAYGPLPRGIFCRGANLDLPGGWDFDGKEPVWLPFRPVCAVWRAATGYAAPSGWR